LTGLINIEGFLRPRFCSGDYYFTGSEIPLVGQTWPHSKVGTNISLTRRVSNSKF
jgi:hypothetical protein